MDKCHVKCWMLYRMRARRGFGARAVDISHEAGFSRSLERRRHYRNPEITIFLPPSLPSSSLSCSASSEVRFTGFSGEKIITDEWTGREEERSMILYVGYPILIYDVKLMQYYSNMYLLYRTNTLALMANKKIGLSGSAILTPR